MSVRLVWAMNVAPPYRLPVWDELAGRLNLEVWLLSANEHNRRWGVPRDTNYPVRLLRTFGLRHGETVHYFMKQRFGWAAPAPDVLMLPGWDSPAAWQMLWWAKRHGVRTIAFNESTLDSRRHTAKPVDLARRSFVRMVDAVLTVSPGSTAAVLASGVPHSRITEITNAVDLATIPSPSSLERPPKGPSEPHTFLFCGQLIARKKPTLLVQALALMDDDSQLLVAGDGPLADQMTKLVKENKLQGRVQMLGYVRPEDLPQVFGRSNTLVLPSDQEVYGLVVTEALAAGLHAVVSERAGIADVIRDMPGTWVTQPEVHPLMRSMTASKRSWKGPVAEPEARKHTPALMAAEIQRVVDDIALARPSDRTPGAP